MRQRLKGASVASYYPSRIGTVAQLRSLYPMHEILDDDEEDWLEHLNVARSRGKATPKKKRTAAGTFTRIVDTHTWLLTCRRIEEVQQEEVGDYTLRYSVVGRIVYLLYKTALIAYLPYNTALNAFLSGMAERQAYSGQFIFITNVPPTCSASGSFKSCSSVLSLSFLSQHPIPSQTRHPTVSLH